MKKVTAREANQAFSKLLRAAAEGEEVVITRRGTPVAKLVSASGSDESAHRKAAIKALVTLLRKGLHLGGLKATRQESHER